MTTNSINGDITLSKQVYKDIISIVMKKFDVFFPAKKDEKYIDIDFDNSELIIILHMKIKQGVDVVKKCKQLQTEIHDNIKLMTGLDVKKINLDIVGFQK